MSFQSFHGTDVRKGFLSHVMREFERKGIHPFIDNDIVRGKSIGPKLIEAIRGSRIAIVLLSKNYASSTWCLDELVEIMKCREEFDQTVMALFYQGDPTDVKKQTGDFGKVFRKTCKGKTKEDVGAWKKALAEVAKIAGYHSSNWDNEAEMIEKMAADVSNELNNSTPSSDFDGLVGMESHMINMGSMLQLDLEEVRMIGIWGPSGIGKTTIARFLFNQHSKKFQMSVFVKNIKGTYNKKIPVFSDDYDAKLYLQQQFMSLITNQKDIEIPHLGIVKDRLKDKKVLAILDDVDQLVQLEAMVNETRWFGSGSRIIVTTQDRKLLKAHKINHIYKVDFPSSDEALEIFCMYAFGQKFPNDGFRELAWEVTRLAGELPLGLRVMGSFFRGMSTQEWTNALPRIRTRLNGEIENILKLSYDALYEEDKLLFLHIACFFNLESVDNVECCLAYSFSSVTHGLHVLAEKSLISMDLKKIEMHDLLVQLGREIVRKQNVSEPGKRQFLVDARDIDEVLNDEKADCRSVIGIDSRFSKITCTSERAFERFSNLQFLKINGGSLNMDSISRKLRFLSWPYFEMPRLPSNFHTKFLVCLDMAWSKLEKLWEGIQPLNNLRSMSLSDSNKLKELPDLSTATNLQELNLRECSSLVEIPSSIGNATNLQKLNLSYCSNLVEIPSSIWNAINLEELDLTHCSSLMEIPSFIRKLDLKECSKLEVFPTNTDLESLDLSDYSSVKSNPETSSTNIVDAKLIKEVTPSSTRSLEIEELGPCIGKISHLRRLVLSGTNLVLLPQLPYSLSFLYARNCESLERLDCIFRNSYCCLDFSKSFKLNQEARDLIIHTPTKRYAVFPGREVPECFNYRGFGSSLSVKLNQKPLRTSTKFKACIVFDYHYGNVKDYGSEDDNNVYCYITSKQNALTACSTSKRETGFNHFAEHLYIFEVEAEGDTSTELDFEFKLGTRFSNQNLRVKECGVFQLGDGDDTEASEE